MTKNERAYTLQASLGFDKDDVEQEVELLRLTGVTRPNRFIISQRLMQRNGGIHFSGELTGGDVSTIQLMSDSAFDELFARACSCPDLMLTLMGETPLGPEIRRAPPSKTRAVASLEEMIRNKVKEAKFVAVSDMVDWLNSIHQTRKGVMQNIRNAVRRTPGLTMQNGMLRWHDNSQMSNDLP